ncbi:hypothetical protein KAU11_10705 [Candidatus Babeliales bacterium]|nr:hypothetical protein [Candidatus Babeliales bacterium]
MKTINFIGFSTLMDRLGMELPNTDFKLNEPHVKQWTYEALRKIASPYMQIKTEIELEVEEGKVQIPSTVNYIRTVKFNGIEPMSEVDSLIDIRYLNTRAYALNGMFLFTNFDSGSITIETIAFPVDEYERPLIQDNEYVIVAIISYIMSKISRKLWINNKIHEKVFREYEQDWLYYVNSATTSTLMSSFDNVNEWKAFHTLMPLNNLIPSFYDADNQSRVVG